MMPRALAGTGGPVLGLVFVAATLASSLARPSSIHQISS